MLVALLAAVSLVLTVENEKRAAIFRGSGVFRVDWVCG
jgi:hypothetical protein